MASQKLCVCNYTREKLIGTKLDFVDTVHVRVVALMNSLSNVPESGMWLNHFRGIPRGPRLSRFDVIYLDEDAKVLDCVENFTEVEFEPIEEEAESAVILPAHALASVNVKRGDQFRICRAGKIVVGAEGSVAGEVMRPDGNRCIRDAMPHDPILPTPKAAQSGRPESATAIENNTQKEKFTFKERLLLWLFPEAANSDRRRGNRLPAGDLVAYYWTGGAPMSYKISNVSTSGLYLYTEERWLPGTRLVMTLQKEGHDPARSAEISRVESEVVRWGLDGIGFRFVESRFVDLNTGEIVQGRVFDQEAFEGFLHRAIGQDQA